MLIWERATAMRENNTKREAMLLGNLRHAPHRAPKGMVKDDKYLSDGDTIRALGVPVGTDFDLPAWWRKRYADVKPRVANWFATSRLSLTGRNMLLQSILYGSFRYWFFTLLVPDEIIDAIESDAKNLLWATTPSLQTNEFGTTARSRRYMIEAASYLPQREGGGSIMHLCVTHRAVSSVHCLRCWAAVTGLLAWHFCLGPVMSHRSLLDLSALELCRSLPLIESATLLTPNCGPLLAGWHPLCWDLSGRSALRYRCCTAVA